MKASAYISPGFCYLASPREYNAKIRPFAKILNPGYLARMRDRNIRSWSFVSAQYENRFYKVHQYDPGLQTRGGIR